jgi:phosphopantetheinyl transferase (holo-ACP synthase)
MIKENEKSLQTISSEHAYYQSFRGEIVFLCQILSAQNLGFYHTQMFREMFFFVQANKASHTHEDIHKLASDFAAKEYNFKQAVQAVNKDIAIWDSKFKNVFKKSRVLSLMLSNSIDRGIEFDPKIVGLLHHQVLNELSAISANLVTFNKSFWKFKDICKKAVDSLFKVKFFYENIKKFHQMETECGEVGLAGEHAE